MRDVEWGMGSMECGMETEDMYHYHNVENDDMSNNMFSSVLETSLAPHCHILKSIAGSERPGIEATRKCIWNTKRKEKTGWEWNGEQRMGKGLQTLQLLSKNVCHGENWM